MASVLATATTIKAPVSQTTAFVGYHLHQGVDHMFVYFDAPKDPAIPRLRALDAVTCVECDRAHWKAHGVAPDAPVQAKQQANATDAFHRARDAGIEWLAHIDGDELLYADDGLRTMITQSPAQADVLIFQTKEAVPQGFHYERPFREISLFKRDPASHLRRGLLSGSRRQVWRRLLVAHAWRLKRRVLQWIGGDAPDLVAGFLLGHTSGKAATRTDVPVEHIGNHRPQVEPGHVPHKHAVPGAAVLHFDCMGYRHWYDKWAGRLCGTAHFDESRLRPGRQRIRDAFEAALEADSDRAPRTLYRRLYHLPPWRRQLLKSFGFVERISLARKAFHLPGSPGRPRSTLPVNKLS